jgi:hypothetical protein
LRLAGTGVDEEEQLRSMEGMAPALLGTGTKLGGMIDEKLSEVVGTSCESVVVYSFNTPIARRLETTGTGEGVVVYVVILPVGLRTCRVRTTAPGIADAAGTTTGKGDVDELYGVLDELDSGEERDVNDKIELGLDIGLEDNTVLLVPFWLWFMTLITPRAVELDEPLGVLDIGVDELLEKRSGCYMSATSSALDQRKENAYRSGARTR